MTRWPLPARLWLRGRARVGLDLRLVGYAWGGTAAYGLELARAFQLLETDLEFVLLRSRKAPPRFEAAPQLRHALCLTSPHHKWEQLTLPVELVPLRLGLLHSIDSVAPLRRTFKSVVTVGDLGFLRFPDTLTPNSLAYYSQVRRSAARADHILTYSAHSADDLETELQLSRTRISVTPLAARASFKPIDETEPILAQLGVARPFILFASTIEPRKNLEMLLRAFALVERRRRGLTLVVAGRRGWRCEPVFTAVRQLGLSEAVRFVGLVSDPELAGLYSAAELLAFPSLYEGFGLPVVEAMTCSCPVLVANSSCLPEVAGEAALLLPPDNETAWALEIERVLDDPDLRADLIRRGLERAKAFSWARTAQATLDVYRQVLQI